MKSLVFLLTVSAVGAPLFAATLTQAERDRAIAELTSSRQQFLDSVAGLSVAQWNFKPDANTWSVAECAEHIAVSEDVIFGSVTKIAQGPAAPDKKSAVTDDFILTAVVDRSHKFQAPEVLRPTHRFATPQEIVDHFKQSREATIAYVRDTQDDLRGHFFDHPVLKTMDGYQWILLLSAHSRRHTAQLNEVKANPNFPKE
ncbi:MAG TPA: DinB family protein [Bryobacteraceae bacterium]|nr:DinB family protein [Bryobacteraceae bacterium]